MKGIIIIDPKKCLACRTCELQCAIVHSKSKELAKAVDEKPLPQTRVKVERIGDLAVPLQCRHCDDTPCVKICPTKAIIKSDKEGPVLIKDDLCVGCKRCIPACPFGAIRIRRKSTAASKRNTIVTKCDLCFERLEKGQFPACVVSCPSKALQFKTIKELNKKKKKEYLVNFKEDKIDKLIRQRQKKQK